MTRAMLVLANAAAGSAEDEAVTAAVAELRTGADVEVVVPEGPLDLRAALARSGGKEVAVLGGDGSVHACLQALAELDLLGSVGPVAVVPLGTGNDLARALRIPLDPVAAARMALDGPARPLDLLRGDNRTVVVNVVHAGVGAEATARAEDVKGLLGTAGYALGAVRAGVAATGWRLRVTVDGRVLHDGAQRVLMVTVGLGSSIGGGTRVTPEASPSDGLADVVLSTATGPLARAGYALALRRERHLGRRDVTAVRGREVTVEALDERNAFRINADGEVSGPHTSRSWRVLPHAWTCRVPAGADG
ncbi:diacylglycerol/lipid kinase family protein [Georgenia sp. AZ-5]|uniref:diacylglycerol/lipid kinase family protein n=1 Tax=Georgenia sp. AZ-5 TaxID=3367526 RepID=UPI003753F0CC